MDWEKASPELGVVLDKLIAGLDCEKKPMFGSPVYFVNNNMFSGVKGGKIFIRLPEADQKAVFSESVEVSPFEPRPNFFMKEYVQISSDKLYDKEFIVRWLLRSYEYVSSLPIKEKKARKKRTSTV